MKRKSKMLPGRSKRTAGLPPPPVPADLDMTGIPPPVDLFIEMAMTQFGMDRETATREVYAVIAEKHGAKGNA